MTVFASLGGAHLHDLAGAAFDNDEPVLAQRRALHRVGGRSAGIGALKRVLMLFVMRVSHLYKESYAELCAVVAGPRCGDLESHT